MDIVEKIQSIVWCKEPWDLPDINDEAKTLLEQCKNITKSDVREDIEDIIERSNQFPIPFPIDTVRLESLKTYVPIERLNDNIKSTYPVIHERLLVLMANFLIYKRKHGSSIEKELYRDMSIVALIDRILTKRSVVFMKKQDQYMLLNGKKGRGGWESIGTEEEKPPLILADCLSYDEIKMSALVAVSGPTACVNEGARRNVGVRSADAEPNAIIIGIVGPRCNRPGCMEAEDILITQEQNREDNGYGAVADPGTPKQLRRKLWTDFYQIPSCLYSSLAPQVSGPSTAPRDARVFTERYARQARSSNLFDARAHHRRLAVLAELALLEADARAKAVRKHAFLNVIGAGLGVWKISPHQLDLYILSFLDRIYALLTNDMLNSVSDVNFAYIKPAKSVLQLFKPSESGDEVQQMFLEWESHPKGGINVQLRDREPAERLRGAHADKLLVLTYPWDGNAHPGNEFWIGKLSSSGDSAAACSTQVSELHNAYINPAVCGRNTRVVGAGGMLHIADYCSELLTRRGR